jgi:phage terminase large subunit
MVVHRRGGKTFCCIQDLLARALTNTRKEPPPRYGYIAPTRDQAKDITWAYLKRFCAPIPGLKINEADLQVTFPTGATIRLYSGDNYERMRGLYFDGVVIDEFGDIDPRAWTEVVRACLSDYLGWATFIGTPKGKNAFYELWARSINDPEWFSMMLKASESGLIPQDELRSLKEGLPAHTARQEFECDFTAPIPGAIYAAVIEQAREQGRIAPFPVDGSNLINTSWDLGAPENMAVWYWQIVGREIRILECDRGDKGTLTQRVAYMLGKGHSFGKHFLPHDAQQTERTGTTFLTELVKAGLPSPSISVVPRTHSVWVGINHALELFPALAFRSPQCDEALAVLAGYRRKVEGEGALSKDEPIHDFTSHTADAFRMMAEAHRAGMVAFRHTTAEVKPSWYGKAPRRGLKAMRVS